MPFDGQALQRTIPHNNLAHVDSHQNPIFTTRSCCPSLNDPSVTCQLPSPSSFTLHPLPMSSTLSFQSAYYYPGQPQSSLPVPEDLPNGCDAPHNFDQNSKIRPHSLFRNGLPTPPTSKAMTGLTLKNHNSNGVSMQAHHLTRYPLNDVSSGGPVTGNQTFDGRENGQQRHGGNFQAHRAGRSKDYGVDTRKSPANIIAANFRIPESVNSSGGSIAEFAAEITCLFWFESAATLQYAEELTNVSYIDRGLLPDATPTIGFRKWVTTILTTTLVSKNVILLALLYIYRLKKFNPGVSGKRGSEFRLLTIALMLGNKFLDDNTYTNKTWAEVSGISVTEIHIMEVEFLSNMRYNLYVSEAEWGAWKVKLGKFGAFFEGASKLVSTDSSAAPVTPMAQSIPHKLPSPPATHHNINVYALPRPSPAASLPNPYSAAPHPPQSSIRPQHMMPEHLSRKRSLDPLSELPSAKRMFNPEISSAQHSTISTPETVVNAPGTVTNYPLESIGSDFNTANVASGYGDRIPRLPMPRIRTTMSQSGDFNSSQLAPLALPNGRAMSTVFSSPSNAWTQQTTPVTTVPFSTTNLYSNPIPSLGDTSRSQSAFGSADVSPSAASYHTATPTRPGLSPSYFLTNRSSPYRPVRNVHTLLIPPPSASLHNPSRNIGHDQMRYQPLSKTTTERRAGVVPYFQQDAWAQGHTFTPSVPAQHDFRT